MPEPGDAEWVLSCCRTVLRALGEFRQEIDAVNVFPVADSDTGTNLYLTVEEAVAAAQAAEPRVDAIIDAFARGAFLGARGNSGAIFAQLVRGLAEAIREPSPRQFAAGLRAGVDAAYAAVGQPVEGTMLTVARAAADAATARAESTADLPHGDAAAPTVVDIVSDALEAARRALEDTPSTLGVLRREGVVDAGGVGVVVALEAGMSELTGQPWPSVRHVRETLRFPPLADESPADATTENHDVGSAATAPMFEVMYLLDASESRVAMLRETLGSLGDSLVVAGHAGEWNVHVHVHDAGAAIDAGLAAGQVRRVSITSVEHHTWQDSSLGSSHAHAHRAGRTSAITRRLVALVTGAGVGDLYEQAGATVIRRDRTGRPSISDLVSMLGSEHADEIVVLPNDGELVPLAEAAADTVRADDRRIVVIPTVSDVPGMAALAVHDPTRAYDVDVVAMAAAAGRARAGAIRTAVDGDVIGTVDGVMAVIGDDPVTVASDVVTRLLGPGGELVTIVVGSEAGYAVGSAVAASVEQDHPEVDVVIVPGEQPDPFIVVGVE